jgi:hypothetical protein
MQLADFFPVDKKNSNSDPKIFGSSNNNDTYSNVVSVYPPPPFFSVFLSSDQFLRPFSGAEAHMPDPLLTDPVPTCSFLPNIAPLICLHQARMFM